IQQFKPDKLLLARLCGFLAGDGSVQVRKEPNGKMHYSVEFFPDDESLLGPFESAFQIIFNKNLSIVRYSNHYRLRCYSKAIVDYLTKIASFGIHEWEVPDSILTTDESKKEWLRAFFDAEAYVGKSVI